MMRIVAARLRASTPLVGLERKRPLSVVGQAGPIDVLLPVPLDRLIVPLRDLAPSYDEVPVVVGDGCVDRPARVLAGRRQPSPVEVAHPRQWLARLPRHGHHPHRRIPPSLVPQYDLVEG